jgi:hypothetical protein
MKLANVLIFFHVAFQNYGGDLYNELLQCILVRTYSYVEIDYYHVITMKPEESI